MFFRRINYFIIFALVIGSGFLVYDRFFKLRASEYIIVFEEPLHGLFIGSQVFVGGVVGGFVQSMDQMELDFNKSVVKVSLQKKIQAKFAVAQLAAQGFTGNKVVNISYTATEHSLEPMHGLEQIKSSVSFMYSLTSFLESTNKDDRYKNLADSGLSIINSLDQVLKQVNTLLTAINETTTVFTPLREKTLKIFDDIANITESTKNIISHDNIKSLLNNDLEIVSDSISSVRLSLDGINDAVNAFNKNPIRFLYSGIKK